MQKKKPNFHPITEARSFLGMIGDMLDESMHQLGNMRQARENPHILNDELVNRCIALYTQQNKDAGVFLEQCALWRKGELTEVHLYQVEEIELLIQKLTKANDEILDIANFCKDRTINKILAKKDFELAFDVLTGKIPFPK